MDHSWKARWIQDPRFSQLPPRNLLHKHHNPPDLPEHDPALRNVHMLVRRPFELPVAPGGASAARLHVTADDYYHLYINGQFVGQGPAPAYHFHYNVNTWDVGDRLVAGHNVIAVDVYYQGLRNRVWNSADYRQGMFAELRVAGQGPEPVVLATDDTWRIKISQAHRIAGVIGYDTQFQEDIDGRLIDWGWSEVGFDDSGWMPPAVRDLKDTDYTFVDQVTPPLAVYSVGPVAARQMATDRYQFDFGRETTGRIALRMSGSAGHKVEVRCGEELNSDGTVRYQMRCNCTYRDYWTLAGRPQEHVEFFDYKAFRYVEVVNSPCPLSAADIRVIARHYPYDERAAALRCSNPVLDDVWTICANSVRDCAQEVIVDCPSREKGQYINDAAVSAHSHMLLTGDTRLTRKVLEDAALSRHVCPGLLAVAPGSHMQEIAEASLLWPVLLWEYYLHSDDLAFVREMLPVVDGQMHYFQRHENSVGLLVDVCEKWNLVDWPPSCRDGYDFDLAQRTGGRGCQTVLNAHYYKFLDACRQLRQAAGQDAVLVSQKLEAFPETFVRTFQHSRSRLFVDAVGSSHSSLHANAMALYAGLVTEHARPAVIFFLRQKGMACGVWFAYFYLRALMEAGLTELAFDLISRDDEHSWPNMLREGATACMEVWGADQKANTSFCHAWASGPVPLLVEQFLGIRHAEPGWRAIRIEPRMPRMLSSVTLQLPLPQGRLGVTYSRGNRQEMYSIHAPPGVKIIGPDGPASAWRARTVEIQRGAHIFERVTG